MRTDKGAGGTEKVSFTLICQCVQPVNGYYEITEKTAPAGYVKTADLAFYFKVENGEVKWLERGTDKPSTWTEKESADMVSFEAAKAADVQKGTAATNAQFTVQNEPGTALPNTGGSGTHFYTILGSILIFGAGVLLWRRRRMI